MVRPVQVAFTATLVCAIVLLSASASWARRSAVWAGYEATHRAFRHVQASWTMPSVSCPGEMSAGYNGEAWFGVGLGPTWTSSEQVVARAFCTGIFASYGAYFEVGGVQATGTAGGVLILYPGDRISASVSYLGVFRYVAGPYTYHLSRYRFSITDRTQRKSFTIVDSSSDCLAHACRNSTAEVFAGIPFTGYGALADYGKVAFSNLAITDSTGRRGAFAKNSPWAVVRLVEYDSSTHRVAASPSSLAHRGTRFSDRWLAY